MSRNLTVSAPLGTTPQIVQDQDGNKSQLRLDKNGTVAIVGPGSTGATSTLTLSTYDYVAVACSPDVQIVATDKGQFNAVLSFNFTPASSQPPKMALNPVLTLGYDGSVTMPQLPNRPSSGALDLTIDAAGNVKPQTSSARFKESIEPLRDDFEKLLLLQPRSFAYRDTGEPGIGYTAEEVAQAGLDHLVGYDSDGRPLSVHYKMLPVYLLELLRAQGGRIDELRAEIERLKGGARSAQA